jgi:hypothetical protein
MGLADKMAKMYGGKEGSKEEESSESSGEADEEKRLGDKLKSALASGDGEMIYSAFSALHAQCAMKS